MGYNRRSNVNAIYCILLGLSLVAIIIVAGMFLIREFGNNEPSQEQTGGNQVMESTAPYIETQAPTESTTPAQTSAPTEPITMPTTAAQPVETVQEYDLNGDGTSENVQVMVDQAAAKATIDVNGLGTLEIGLEPMGANAGQHLTVVGSNLASGSRLVAIEYTYSSDGMGLVKSHVWKYSNNTFVKIAETLYSGRVGNQGFMDAGIIENRVPEDSFAYNAEVDKNNYIYERSRVIADMKDLGIKLPFGTVGTYAISYDDNVTFFYDTILQ